MKDFSINKIALLLSATLLLCIGCSESAPNREAMQSLPKDSLLIYPDYKDVTLPANIAPLHFRLETPYEKAWAVLSFGNMQLVAKADGGQFSFPKKQWEELLAAALGKQITVEVSYENQGKQYVFAPFVFFVAPEPIDGALVYRRIQPGYELWNTMGIYKRDLTSFDETALLENKSTQKNCMNCHSFCNGDSDKMLYHFRGKVSGTFIQTSDTKEQINTSSPKVHTSLSYPAWHPNGKLIAFSSNDTKQGFHTNDANRVEVFDLSSDIVVYDTERKETFTSPLLMSKASFETFPSFSPDGRTLYFTSADSCQMPASFEQVRYHLCSIAFDPATRQFGNRVDTLYNADLEGGSASFPRVSPDGKHLVYTRSDYGNFSIWHKEADLYIIDLTTKQITPLTAANSTDVESYHSWSRNSRWMVFSSRRGDGLYTRPYLVYIDSEGRAARPFLLPQEDTNYYERSLDSFNIPELVEN